MFYPLLPLKGNEGLAVIVTIIVKMYENKQLSITWKIGRELLRSNNIIIRKEAITSSPENKL